MRNIFVGYDPVESISWFTLVNSIMERSSVPIAVTPVNLDNLKEFYKRPPVSEQSNSFSFSRFLVPTLMNHQGFGLFCDCDQLMRCDVEDLFRIAEENQDKAVHVVQHDYVPRDAIKYLGNVQHSYPRKNWSSVVLWNCAHPSNACVTSDLVNTAAPSFLHRFSWLDDEEIGELDLRWNWLVGEYDNPPEDVKIVHWTVGGPYFHEYRDVDFSSEWFDCYNRMVRCDQREAWPRTYQSSK